MSTTDVRVPPVTLGRSGLQSSKVGLGCAVWPHKLPFADTVEMLRYAFSIGVRHLDLAPLYGTEETIGRALKEVDVPDGTVISTKSCAYLDDLGIMYREYSGMTVRRSVERSLRRLGVPTLDVVHLHDVEPEDLPRIFDDDGALSALLELKEKGVVRSVGFATQSLEALAAAVDSGLVDHIQPYHCFTLLNTELEDRVLPAAKERGISILNNAPYAGYILLSGSKAEEPRYNYRRASDELIAIVAKLEQECERLGVTLPAAALAFSLLDPRIDVTVIGASSQEKLRQRVAALECGLTSEDFAALLRTAGGPHPIASPYSGRNPFMDDRW